MDGKGTAALAGRPLDAKGTWLVWGRVHTRRDKPGTTPGGGVREGSLGSGHSRWRKVPDGSGMMAMAGVRLRTVIVMHRPGGAVWGYRMGAMPIEGHGGKEQREGEVER